MKITSEIISTNLQRLEIAKKEFQPLYDYHKALELKTDEYQPALSNIISTLRKESTYYGLSQFINFVDFIVESKSKNQEVFYKNKIKSKDFQDKLVYHAIDDDAKKCFKSKTKKSFEKFINSKRFEVLTANVSNRNRRTRRYNNNLKHTDALVANFVIQNSIEIEYGNLHRINRFYTSLLPIPDTTIKKELFKTKEIVDFLINSFSESGVDFRKLNYEYLIKNLEDDLKNRMLMIETGEKIKCIEISPDTSGLTIDKVYDVISKTLESGRLKVTINNDNGNKISYNYRFFETISNLRDSSLDELLKDL